MLGTRWRDVALGRSRRAPRHAILDSQSVKTAAEGQVELHITAKPKKPKSSRCRIKKRGGFKPIRFRWRVECTFAWLGQCRLLSKEYEKTVASAEA